MGLRNIIGYTNLVTTCQVMRNSFESTIQFTESVSIFFIQLLLHLGIAIPLRFEVIGGLSSVGGPSGWRIVRPVSGIIRSPFLEALDGRNNRH
jgi:hypothetical protein